MDRDNLKRKYTLTPEALKQRQEAARGAKGSGVARNAYKHGRYAQSFLTQLTPCKTTCDMYFDCAHVLNGTTQAGGTCFDKNSVLQNFQALITAIRDKQFDDLNELAAVTMAGAIDVIQRCIRDIVSDGTIVNIEKTLADGTIIKDKKPNPSLLALPKLLADMGLNPQEYLLTPRSRSRADADENATRTLAEMMSMIPKPPR